MPIYLDRHFVEGATKHAVAGAHQKDLDIQAKHDIQFLTYWFDEARCTAFCLVHAPDKESVRMAHNEAHGLVPSEILEVDPKVVEAFLGRIGDPVPLDTSSGKPGEVPIDSGFRTIMFTDLKDSTLMTTMFGDSKALHLLHIHNAMIRNGLRDHGGREVKHTGDGMMVSFVSAKDAVDCAIGIQKGFAVYNLEHPDESMHVRIGMSAGEPIEEHGDLFGKAVQLAARLCAHADPGKILVAHVVRQQCKETSLTFSDLGQVTAKGFSEAIQVYEVKLS
ncbi:MAG: nickel-binding protein [Bacteroidota bacterium]